METLLYWFFTVGGFTMMAAGLMLQGRAASIFVGFLGLVVLLIAQQINYGEMGE